jgi:tetratricopeptide (TPR) repeat protein/acyl carrier protein
MNARDNSYHRLKSFAIGFKDRFALLLVRSSHFDVQREWQERLSDDLKKENIQVVHIRGDDLADVFDNSDVLVSITSIIQNYIPKKERYLLSFSHFDYYMMPTFSNNLKGKDLLSENYRPEPAPPSFVQRLNVERDAIVKAFPVPIIFWASAAAVRQLAEYAPDFYDFRQFIIDLPQPTELRTLPSLPRASFIKIPKPEPLTEKTIRQLNEELESLRSQNRNEEEGKRLINILNDMATYNGSEENWNIGLSQLKEALDEAKRLNLMELQANIEGEIALFHQKLNHQDDALLHQEKANALYLYLAEKNSAIYLPGFINMLNQKAIMLVEMDKRIAAHQVYREAIKLSRELFRKEKQSNAPLLAEVLNNSAMLLTELGQWKKAEAYYQEAIELYRILPNIRYRILLALVLNNLGNLMATMNRLDEALPFHQEALHLRKLSFNANPKRYRADLSQSLYNLSLIMAEMGNFQQAKKIFDEFLKTMSYLTEYNYEFLGCGDNRTHIHGFRIELGEIETLLGQHPAVQDVLAMAREGITNGSGLTAYISLKKGQTLKPDELENFLREKLPEYMIPAHFIPLENVPLTIIGDFDRKGLPGSNNGKKTKKEKAFTSPRNDIERTLCEIWSEVLGVVKVDIHDNFYELGGDSLKVVILVSIIHDIFNVDIEIKKVFQFPTVETQAEIIQEKLQENVKIVEEAPK